MASAFLRRGLQSVISKSVNIDKRVLPKTIALFADLRPIKQPFSSTMIRRMSSKRNVHQSRASASVDEESDSDSDSDEERDLVSFVFIKTIDNTTIKITRI
ncbi:hypothetical protein KQX54_008754 [Cotesia glomerata]|uniref:Uncharacterized protein n=1 Tax=Cotesia glomerata TaxID=32391 RepID=A0AAV7J213_COTGL|nr:hypothetical protein KQX54_008754 [Cotesia glomerata]